MNDATSNGVALRFLGGACAPGVAHVERLIATDFFRTKTCFSDNTIESRRVCKCSSAGLAGLPIRCRTWKTKPSAESVNSDTGKSYMTFGVGSCRLLLPLPLLTAVVAASAAWNRQYLFNHYMAGGRYSSSR